MTEPDEHPLVAEVEQSAAEEYERQATAARIAGMGQSIRVNGVDIVEQATLAGALYLDGERITGGASLLDALVKVTAERDAAVAKHDALADGISIREAAIRRATWAECCDYHVNDCGADTGEECAGMPEEGDNT